MSTKNDGGPAFPVTPVDSDIPGIAGGMTLRDWFAGQALAGILADPHSGGSKPTLANHAYEYADAMIARRSAP